MADEGVIISHGFIEDFFNKHYTDIVRSYLFKS